MTASAAKTYPTLPLFTATQAVAQFGGVLIGNPESPISAIAPLLDAQAGQATFLAQTKWRSQLASSRASVLLCRPTDYEFCQQQGIEFAAYILSDNPYAYFARLSACLLRLKLGNPPYGQRHSSAQIDPTAQLADDVIIEANVVIGAHVVLAEKVWIGANCVIANNVQVGAKTRLYPNVTLYSDCQIGQGCIIHAGAVLGADGFGFAPDNKHWIKIPQVGRVLIGDDVEIGANTTIDRGTLQDTVIEEGVKLDNLIMLAHNVRIGAHTVIAANTGIAGSTTIGKYCQIAGACNIVGHIQIVDDCIITGNTTVTRSIQEPGVYAGIFPFDKAADWERNAPVIRQLRSLRDRIRALEKQLIKH